MKKNIVILSLIFILILCIIVPIVVKAVGITLTYNEEGRLIIQTGKAIPNEIEEGTKIVLEVSPENYEKTEKQRIEEKMNVVDNNIITYSEENIRTIQEEIDEYMNNEKEKEEEFLVILKKYYGNQETENLLQEIKSETENKNNSFENYSFPQSGKKLLNVVIDICKRENVSNEEKECLKYVVQGMDLTTLDDKELADKIDNL